MSWLVYAASVPLLALAQVGNTAVHTTDFAGLGVGDTLRALSSAELRFVFSTALVPETLRTGSIEPDVLASGEPLRIARAVLAQHGLELTQVQPGLYAVVQGSTPPSTATMVRPGTQEVDDRPLLDIVISASRYRIGTSTEAPFELARAELTDQPALGDDPVRSLSRLPGITQDGLSAQPNVRGGEAGEVLMLLDGYPLRRAFHLSGYQSLFSVLDSGIVRGADIFTGAYPARYGNRMSAVFDFQSIHADDEPRHAVGLDFFNASARSSGNIPSADVDYLAAARVGTLSPLLRAFAPSAGDPRYLDTYLRLEHGDVQTLRVSGNLIWARNELRIQDEDTGETAQFEDRLQYAWLRAEREFTPDLQLQAWLGQTSLQSFREGSVASPGIVDGHVQDRRSSTILDLRTLLRWQIRPGQGLDIGADFTQEEGRYLYAATARFAPAAQQLFAIPATLDRATDLDLTRRRSELFVSHRWQAGSTFSTEIGVRALGLVSSGLEANWSFEPRTALRWQFSPRSRLNLSAGRYHQADEVHELKVEDGLVNFSPPQRSDHLVAGIEHQLNDAVQLRAEVFSKRQAEPRARYENLLNRRTLLPEIAPDRVQILPDGAELEGVELSGEYRQSNWQSWASLTWQSAYDETAGVETQRSWDQQWAVQVGTRWQRGPWMTTVSALAHGGFPITALQTTASGVVLGERNAAHLANFFELNLRVQYSQLLPLGQLDYSLELINATAQRNPCCTELVATPAGLRGQTLRGLALIPSLGIRWSW